MVTMTIVYPYDADQPFDEAYYNSRHMPLAREVWGDAVSDVAVYHALAGLTGDPAFSTVALVEFTSMEAFQKAMANPRTAEVNADVANFTAVKPNIQLSRRA